MKSWPILRMFCRIFYLGCLPLKQLYCITLPSPPIKKENFCKGIVADRICREGGPRLDVWRSGEKIIANNYGHCGSGWSMGPGAARHVAMKLHEALQGSKPALKSGGIAIIGSGVSGMMTALHLSEILSESPEISCPLTIYYKDPFQDTTSMVAGGMFEPDFLTRSPDQQKLSDEIIEYSFRFYQNIAKQADEAMLPGGVKITTSYVQPGYENYEPLVRMGLLRKSTEEEVCFRGGQCLQVLRNDQALFMDVQLLLKEMHAELIERGVSFVKQQVASFSDLRQRVIVNASSLGAKELVKDESLYRIQGHLLLLQGQPTEGLDYMFVMGKKVRNPDKGQGVGKSSPLYFFPKGTLDPDAPPDTLGVLGGSFIRLTPDDNSLNSYQFRRICNDARELFSKGG